MYLVIIELERPDGNPYYIPMIDSMTAEDNIMAEFEDRAAIRVLKAKHMLGAAKWIAVSPEYNAAQEVL